MEEVWKNLNEIPGMEGYSGYQISSHGRLKSFKYDKVNGKILKLLTRISNGGQPYLVKDLICSITKEKHKFAVHRLVLMAFKYIENHTEMTGDHIDENTLNNNIDNLQWLTIGDNVRRSLAGSQTFEDANKVAEEYLSNPDIRLIDLAEKYGCSLETMWRTVNEYSTIPNVKKKKTFSKEQRRKIAETYLSGKTLKEVAAEFDCCMSLVSFIVKQYKRGELNDLS